MKTKSNALLKPLFAIALFFALLFTNNTYATTTSGNTYTWKKKTSYKKYKPKKFRKKYKHKKPDSIPLDGGLSILLLGAAAFGVNKLRQNKND